MPELAAVQTEIKNMRVQTGRQRREILRLQRDGFPTASAEVLLERMLAKLDTLCIERERLKANRKRPKRKMPGVENGDAPIFQR